MLSVILLQTISNIITELTPNEMLNVIREFFQTMPNNITEFISKESFNAINHITYSKQCLILSKNKILEFIRKLIP